MNVIETVTKYLPILDEQYKMEARSSILDTPPAFMQETRDAKKVKIAKMDVDGLADYSRNGGFTTGAMDLTWEEHEYTQDRGRALQIDALDNLETFGLAFGRLAGEFQRKQVIPEIDAYRFSQYFQKAGTKVKITVTSGAIMKFIDAADAQLDEDEVPENDRYLFVNPQVFKLMLNDPTLEKHLTVNESEDKMANKKFYYYDNHLIIKVPSARFFTKINLLDGKTAGQEKGGYVPAEDAEVIGMLMIQPSAVLQGSKRRIARVWAPTKEEAAGTDGVNPNADAWKFDFRVYHDAWVEEEKLAGVYGATIEGEGISFITIDPGSYNSSTREFTKGATYSLKLEGTTAMVKGTIPYKDADSVLGLPAGNRIDLLIKNSAITSKNALPSGKIVRALQSDGTWQEYTKDAFEDDGSLILNANVNNLRVGIYQIAWVENEVVTYTVNTLNAKLGAAH